MFKICTSTSYVFYGINNFKENVPGNVEPLISLLTPVVTERHYMVAKVQPNLMSMQ